MKSRTVGIGLILLTIVIVWLDYINLVVSPLYLIAMSLHFVCIPVIIKAYITYPYEFRYAMYYIGLMVAGIIIQMIVIFIQLLAV